MVATWAEEETGRSSAGPCRIPSASAWASEGVTRRGPGSRRLLRHRIDRGGRASPNPPHDQVHDPDDHHRDEEIVHVLEVVAPALPVAAHGPAQEAQARDPGDRSQG